MKPGPNSASPLGVFDSGVGGLTVLRALHARLPEEGSVYLGDTARVPYGSRSGRVVRRYAVNNARFLIERADVKLLVVACNTVSAVALEPLREAVDVPVIGVVEPGARLAVRTTRTGRIAVIGTRATMESGAYQRAVLSLDQGIDVVARPCPLLVPLAEEGWLDGPVVSQIIETYLGDLPKLGVDTLVLGCTHYPLLKHAMAEVLGEAITLVDSAEAIAEETGRVLRETGLGAPSKEAPALRQMFVTDVPHAFAELASRFLGDSPSEPEQVDIPT